MPGLFPVCVHHVYKINVCIYDSPSTVATIRVVQEARRNLRHCVLPGQRHRHWHLAPTLASGIDTGTDTDTDTVALPREYVCTLW
jgi:hypothetical protein